MIMTVKPVTDDHRLAFSYMGIGKQSVHFPLHRSCELNQYFCAKTNDNYILEHRKGTLDSLQTICSRTWMNGSKLNGMVRWKS